MPELTARKQRLRVELLAARRARSAPDLAAARTTIRSIVLSRLASSGWTCVAAYEPLRTEPGSVELLSGLLAAGARVLVPVTLPDRDLDWVEWGGVELLGVDAVATASAVLVPALAVASDGTRLGRGGGSYDRSLARCGADATIAALVFDGEVVDELPTAPWDRPVTDVVTPTGWRTLRGNTGVARAR